MYNTVSAVQYGVRGRGKVFSWQVLISAVRYS
jgi:hypothetical protein